MSYKLDFKTDILNVQEANPVLCSGQFANLDAANTALRLILIKHVIPELTQSVMWGYEIKIDSHNMTVVRQYTDFYGSDAHLILLNVSIVWIGETE